ncbi:MAG: hypothetical protein ACYS5W_11495 [Planctomycetota bacterium]|jgi:hypothetical protein
MSMSFKKHAAVIGAAIILLAAGPQGGTKQNQDPEQDQDKRTSQGFVLKAGEHSLREVIQDAAKFLGRNYLTSDGDFGNSPTINLDKTLNLDVFGCEEVVSQLAYSRDFAMTPVDPERGIYEFIFTRGPRRPEISTRSAFMKPEEVLRRPKLKMMVTTAVHLEHGSAAKVSATMRPFFAMGGAGPGGVQIGTAGTERTLLLQGFTDQVAAVLKMVAEVDKAAKASPDVYERLGKIERRLTVLERQASAKK